MDKFVNKKTVIILSVLLVIALAAIIVLGVALKKDNDYIVNYVLPNLDKNGNFSQTGTPEWLAAPISEEEAAKDGFYNPEFMQMAIDNAKNNQNGGPIGAVIVKDGKVIASVANENRSQKHSYAHAEMCAIKAAEEALNKRNLAGCQLYTSAQPCLMCASAIAGANIDVVYYAATMEDMKNAGFDDQSEYDLLLGGKNISKSVAVDAPDKLAPFAKKGK